MHALMLLMAEHKRAPFEGPVLMLGRQLVPVSYPDILAELARNSIAPHELPAGQHLGPIIPNRAGMNETSDEVFFRLLVDDTVQALDFSPDEGADIIADLNLPLDPELHGRFGLIVDGGTLEHVFDLRQCFRNCAELLKPGGRIIHITPVNNYVNHGFIQASPTLLFDYYETNDFVDAHALIIVQPRYSSTDPTWMTRPWNVFQYDPVTHGAFMFSHPDDMMAIFFVATKTENSTSDRIPIQSFYNPNRRRAAASQHWVIKRTETGLQVEPA